MSIVSHGRKLCCLSQLGLLGVIFGSVVRFFIILFALYYSVFCNLYMLGTDLEMNQFMHAT